MVNEVVVLALLQQGPRHGYRLLKEAHQLIGPEETLDPKRLYPTMRRLEAEGRIVSHPEPSALPGRPARKVYRLTAEGTRQLQALVADPGNADDRRRFFLALALLDLVPPADRRRLLDQRLVWLDRERERLGSIAARPVRTRWSAAVLAFQTEELEHEYRWIRELCAENEADEARRP